MCELKRVLRVFCVVLVAVAAGCFPPSREPISRARGPDPISGSSTAALARSVRASVASTQVPPGTQLSVVAPSADPTIVPSRSVPSDGRTESPRGDPASVLATVATAGVATANPTEDAQLRGQTLPESQGDPRGILQGPGIGEFTVPDCNGGRVRAPRWLTRVPFWAALCIHAPAQKDARVDIGSNLVSHDGISDGRAAVEYQVYYSLSQIVIPRGRKQVVWAVCGGAGDWLWSGSRVIPGHRLPGGSTTKLAGHLSTLIAIDADIEMFSALLLAAGSSSNARDIENRLKLLDSTLTDAAGLLRDALIQENRTVLTKSGRPKGPIWR